MARQIPSRLENGGVDQIIRDCSSPPCWLHEVKPAYLGIWTENEVLAFLHKLLNMELTALADVQTPTYSRVSDETLAVQLNHAACCVILRKQIVRQGGTSTPQKLSHRPRDKNPKRVMIIALRHQRALARTIDQALLKIFDSDVRRALNAVRQVHLDQIDQLASPPIV